MVETPRRSKVIGMLLIVLHPALGHLYWGRTGAALVIAFGPALAMFLASAGAVARIWPVWVPIAAVLAGHGVTMRLVACALLAFEDPPEAFERRWFHGFAGHLGLAVTGFAASVLAVFMVRSQVVEPYRIPSAGVAPNIVIGDHILARKSWKLDDISRGTVIVFEYPRNRRMTYIQRVVALPGDTLRVSEHRVTVNGTPATYAPAGRQDWSDSTCAPHQSPTYVETVDDRSWTVLIEPEGRLADMPTVTVPPDSLFVMGDNRAHSEDSREWGFVPLDHVKGTVHSVWLSVDPCTGTLRGERRGPVR